MAVPSERPMYMHNRANADVAASGNFVRGNHASHAAEYGSADVAVDNGVTQRPPTPKPKPALVRFVSPDKVLQAFNTWAFKREQPSDPDLMRQIISKSMSVGAPIPFVLYWGKGPRDGLDNPDIECLEF